LAEGGRGRRCGADDEQNQARKKHRPPADSISRPSRDELPEADPDQVQRDRELHGCRRGIERLSDSGQGRHQHVDRHRAQCRAQRQKQDQAGLGAACSIGRAHLSVEAVLAIISLSGVDGIAQPDRIDR
jgi:hypothetical protein